VRLRSRSFCGVRAVSSAFECRFAVGISEDRTRQCRVIRQVDAESLVERCRIDRPGRETPAALSQFERRLIAVMRRHDRDGIVFAIPGETDRSRLRERGVDLVKFSETGFGDRDVSFIQTDIISGFRRSREPLFSHR
jgi:hypothetical protein